MSNSVSTLLHYSITDNQQLMLFYSLLHYTVRNYQEQCHLFVVAFYHQRLAGAMLFLPCCTSPLESTKSNTTSTLQLYAIRDCKIIATYTLQHFTTSDGQEQCCVYIIPLETTNSNYVSTLQHNTIRD